MTKYNYTYSIRKGQRLALFDEVETRAIVVEAMAYMTSLCSMSFRLIDDEKKATLRWSFWPNDAMRQLGGRNTIPGGLADSKRKWIAINSERKMYRRDVLLIAMHEFGHWLRMGHAPLEDSKAMMHPYITNPPKPSEVLWIQKRWGVPSNQFYPYQRVEVAKKYEAQDAEYKKHFSAWQQAKSDRARFENTPNVDSFLEAHSRVQHHLTEVRRLLPAMIDYSKEYWSANDQWKDIPMAHVKTR